ncbi:MAG: hypothetical protein ACMUIA_08260 [bacterium]
MKGIDWRKRISLVAVMVLVSFIFLLGQARQSEAYYGGLYGGFGGLYGLGGLYGGLGMYGGMYGLGMYGLGGLGMYGLGGLGMYGLGGLGMYGLGGLGMYGLGGLSGLGGLGSLLGLGVIDTATLSPAATVAAPVVPSAAPAAVIAEQAGYWSGIWLSYLKLKGGPMTLNLVEDPLTGALAGTATLILNQFKIPPVDVTGIDTGIGSFTLTGTWYDVLNLITWVVTLNCVMTSDTTMTGDFYIADQLYTKVDYGTFDLSLGASTTLVPTLPII